MGGTKKRTMSRRGLFKAGAAATLVGLGPTLESCSLPRTGNKPGRIAKPGCAVITSTWDFGMRANEAALAVAEKGGSALDTVEAGVRVIEADPTVTSVGYGGAPNSDGVVQLDAAVMDGTKLRCGGVAAIEDIKHPVSVARKVMELTPHVLLVGGGARKFALANGFKAENLLTEASRKQWQRKKAAQKKPPVPGPDDHDTIGMIALDLEGRIAAAVTTSGLGHKLPGRVGDSPLIGCGLYADQEVGACVSTGVGEEAIRVLGSFLTVELMRRGADPLSAVMETLARVRKTNPEPSEIQLAFLAMSIDGTVRGGALEKGFDFALTDTKGRHELIPGQVL